MDDLQDCSRDDLVNLIEDLRAEVAALKSRCCESCKWWTLGQNNQNWGECAHGVAYENFSGGGVRGTFGCIHWEARDDS